MHQNSDAPDNDERLTIADMSRIYGISLRTLRFYEQMGLISPQRVGQRRLYTTGDKTRLKLVIAGRKLGFSLREINAMIQSHLLTKEVDPSEVIAMLDIDTLEKHLSSLERQKSDLDEKISELREALEGKPPGRA